jgi:hypothetical protein
VPGASALPRSGHTSRHAFVAPKRPRSAGMRARGRPADVREASGRRDALRSTGTTPGATTRPSASRRYPPRRAIGLRAPGADARTSRRADRKPRAGTRTGDSSDTRRLVELGCKPARYTRGLTGCTFLLGRKLPCGGLCLGETQFGRGCRAEFDLSPPCDGRPALAMGIERSSQWPARLRSASCGRPLVGGPRVRTTLTSQCDRPNRCNPFFSSDVAPHRRRPRRRRAHPAPAAALTRGVR